METHRTDQPAPPAELIHYLCRYGRLNHIEACQLVREILAYYDETAGTFIRRRHMELQRAGFSNADIYRSIADEMPQRRFTAEPLSERQIRRTIYG